MGEDQLQPATRPWLRFVLPIAVIALAKLWLVHHEEIAGSATHYDALWFVKSARDWYWRADYSWIAFIRPPAYPLWLALSHALGVPQRVAIELLQLSGFAALVGALARVGFSRGICIAGFAAACFHPAGFQLNNYTLADPFYAGVLPFVLAGMVSMIAKPRIAVAVATGVGLAVLWLTREESVLVAFLAAAFSVIWLVPVRSAAGWLRRVAPHAIVMLGVLTALLGAVDFANKRTFLAFAKSDMSAPSFQRATDALLRIKPRETWRFAPVPMETFERAFAASPTFARLAPDLRGGVGEAWRIASFNHSRTHGQFATDLIPWAIRNAAEANGIHADAAKAKQFYTRVARELNQACDTGQLETRVVIGGSVGANLITQWPHVPASLGRMLALFVGEYAIAPVRDDESLEPLDRGVYDEITLRRSPESLPPRAGDFATAVENMIGRAHWFFIYAFATAAIAATGALAIYRSRLRARDPANAALMLLFIALASRLALLTAVDASSWPVAFDRFVFPLMPISSIFLVALTWHGWRVMTRREAV